MKYYTVQDVMNLTGKSENKSYQIIRELNKQFYSKYPEAIPIQGQVPAWYFDEAMGINKPSEEYEKDC